MHKKQKNEVPEYTFKLASDACGKPLVFEEDQENIKVNRQAEVGNEDMFSYIPEVRDVSTQNDDPKMVYERLIKAGEYYK